MCKAVKIRTVKVKNKSEGSAVMLELTAAAGVMTFNEQNVKQMQVSI